MLFHPPFLLAGTIGGGFLLCWLAPAAFLPVGYSKVLGPALSAVALGLFGWSVFSMLSGGGSLPTNRPTPMVVVRGPYRFSRNPIYLAMALLHLGIGAAVDCLWFFGLVVLFVILIGWGVIAREERYLERKFGAEYLAYKARVRRWL